LLTRRARFVAGSTIGSVTVEVETAPVAIAQTGATARAALARVADAFAAHAAGSAVRRIGRKIDATPLAVTAPGRTNAARSTADPIGRARCVARSAMRGARSRIDAATAALDQARPAACGICRDVRGDAQIASPASESGREQQQRAELWDRSHETRSSAW